MAACILTLHHRLHGRGLVGECCLDLEGYVVAPDHDKT